MMRVRNGSAGATRGSGVDWAASTLRRVEARGLGKSYGSTKAVQGFDLAVRDGEILALLGPSGCGKTTALRLIAGFERPDTGCVTIGGEVVADAATGAFRPPERRHIGMVFQDYALFPHLTVAENIGYGVKRGETRSARIERIANLVGLEGTLLRLPHQLSGGQQQRVALARALAPQPTVLLLDEPFSNLDARRRASVREEVREILKSTGTTALFVTHDQDEALFMGDRVAVMNRGTVEQAGSPEDIFHEPATRFVAEFLGDTSFMRGTTTTRGVATALGVLPQSLVGPTGAAVDVLVRPDDVEFAPDLLGDAVVEGMVFRGMHNQYRIRLGSGERIFCLTDHCVRLAAGTPVTVRVRACHPLACFAEGQSVNVVVPAANGREEPASR